MSNVPNNILVNVETYNKAMLAWLLNTCPMLAATNKRFKDFQQANPANLGQTMLYDLPPRAVTVDNLVVSFEAVEQRFRPLTVTEQASVGFNITAQQLIFNLEDYMDRFGESAVLEIGSKIENNIAKNSIANTYRFYGNGVTPINSFSQLAEMLAFFRAFGAAKNKTQGFLDMTAVPGIVNTGLNQFAPDRNNRMANSWELGEFSRCEWFESNMLATHIAGTEGQKGSTLTVVSTTQNAEGGVISITFSGTFGANDPLSIAKYDKFEFNDGVSGFNNMRYLTFIGHIPSPVPVQFQATAAAASNGSNQVTVSINPPLQAASGLNQNLNQAILPGMQVSVLPSHRSGLLHSGDQFYLAMPSLPDVTPFPSSVVVDNETGASMRMYSGAVFGQNQYATVHDCIWGSDLVPDNAMEIVFPL